MEKQKLSRKVEKMLTVISFALCFFVGYLVGGRVTAEHHSAEIAEKDIKIQMYKEALYGY
jgi:hypothetical protein